MSILKTLIDEMAAGGSTGAGSIAATPGSLFAGGVIDQKKTKKRQGKMLRRIMQVPAMTSIKEDISPAPGSTNFDPADVISKMDAAEKRVKTEDDTVAFGLEDENGNTVKVYVKTDQAEDFETALGNALAGADEDEDDINSAPEIAEVLYKLKDSFDIVGADWPEIEGDEEEQEQVVGDEGAEGEGGMGAEGAAGEEGDMGDMGAEGDMGEEGDMGAEGDMGLGDEEAATSALQQVIDVMKSDAEAKRAEADARTAEAKAKEAEYAAQSAAHKVKQEEQVLDMESYNNEKKSQEKETKRLAQLAKYQHDRASDMETSLGGDFDTPMESVEEVTLNELSEHVLEFLREQV